MEILQVNKKLLKDFINIADSLYKEDNNYVPYMRADLKKTLNKLLFEDKTYFALLAKDNGETLGRVLVTVAKNKQLNNELCGFFSMFECVNNQIACNALLDKAAEISKAHGANYICGTYFPYDQDNRRGILVQGFDRAPLIFTSYNKPYYDALLSNYGMTKQADTYEYTLDLKTVDYERLEKIDVYSKSKFGFHVDTVDFNNLDRDIRDVQQVMERATTDIIYQDAPDVAALNGIVKQWKNYLVADYILIARKNDDNTPIGVVIALPDFFEVFKKMNGKTDLKGIIAFVKAKKHIKSARAIMQYVLPQYQKYGVAISLYNQMGKAFKHNKVEYVELGTIMENNTDSNSAIVAIGGKIARIYRIYEKRI